MLNFVMRGVCNYPQAALWWLKGEKLPAIARSLTQSSYVETSHLFCKGFIEPMLDLGLRPSFIILRRPAQEVASSLHAIGCIPERTVAGNLVLLNPRDRIVRKLPGWEGLSDYQLCYWYACEIEHKQTQYEQWLPTQGCDTMQITFDELLDRDNLFHLARFVTGSADPKVNLKAAETVLAHNQNPRQRHNSTLRPAPADREGQEKMLDEMMAAS